MDSRGGGDRSALASVEPSITPSIIIDVKTTEVPLSLRVRGLIEVREAWAFSVLRVAVITGELIGSWQNGYMDQDESILIRGLRKRSNYQIY
jgi:hypothetical protein